MRDDATTPLADLHRQMARMRFFEEALAELWQQGKISGELHLGIGEEGIIAGVVDHMRDGDGLALDHRGTPALVGRGVDLTAMTAEVLGRTEGLQGGRGGHMHLLSPSHLAASSGIVGASAPTACGLAMAGRRLRPGSVAVAFFGEGALNQGMVMEAFNLAVVWKLPVVFVCKDNRWSIFTRSADMTGGDPLTRARSFGVAVSRVDGTDVGAVWKQAGAAITAARRGRGPQFLSATCRRPGGHFEGDPLVKQATQAKAAYGDLPAIGRALLGRHGDSPRARVRGLGAVLGTLGQAALHFRGTRDDPLARGRRALDPVEAERIETAARTEVAAAVQRATASGS